MTDGSTCMSAASTPGPRRAGLFAGDNTLIPADPRNRGRLYRNNGDGTFTDVAERAGVRNDRYAKGAAWGDFDDDGDPDLYVSNFGEENRLYRNNGDGTFTDVARELGVSGPLASFACGFLDFDNDGRLDLFVSEYRGSLEDWVAGDARPRAAPSWAIPGCSATRARRGSATSRNRLGWTASSWRWGWASATSITTDISTSTWRPAGPTTRRSCRMRCTGTSRGAGSRTSPCPSEPATCKRGTGSRSPITIGTATSTCSSRSAGRCRAIGANNLLFRNPGHGRHWLEVKLAGTRTNRAGIGARIRVDFTTRSGSARSVFRQVGATSSYGGSSLAEHVGLGDAATVDAVTITWPASRTTQTFRRIPADRTIEVTEGTSDYRTVEPAKRPPVGDRTSPAAPDRGPGLSSG